MTLKPTTRNLIRKAQNRQIAGYSKKMRKGIADGIRMMQKSVGKTVVRKSLARD